MRLYSKSVNLDFVNIVNAVLIRSESWLLVNFRLVSCEVLVGGYIQATLSRSGSDTSVGRTTGSASIDSMPPLHMLIIVGPVSEMMLTLCAGIWTLASVLPPVSL